VSRKTIGYRLFRLGRVPRGVRPRLEAEGVRLLDEGIRVDLSLRGYRAPGRFFGYRRQLLSGSIVLTSARLAGYVWWGTLFDVPLGDPRLAKLDLSIPRRSLLQVAFDAADFGERRSGRVLCRFRTETAEAFVASIATNLRQREAEPPTSAP